MGKLTVSELDRLATELAHLSRSGVPLPDGLQAFARSIRRGRLKTVANEAASSMRQGKSLSSALSETKTTMPQDFIHLVRVGEISGDLQSILFMAAEQARRLKNHRAALGTALSYPILVLIGVFVIFAILANTFLAEVQGIFHQLGMYTLPAATRIIFQAASLFQGVNGVITAIAFFALIITAWLPPVRNRLYLLLLKAPGLSMLSSLSDTSVLAHSLATLLSHGVPLGEALRAAKLAVWERHFARALEFMAKAADRGKPTAAELPRTTPPTAAWLYAEAERHGELAGACEGIAHYTDEWFERMSRRSIVLIEPLLVVCLAVLVGFIVVSTYLPLFMIPKVLGGG